MSEWWEKASSFYFLRHEKNEMCLTARWLFRACGQLIYMRYYAFISPFRLAILKFNMFLVLLIYRKILNNIIKSYNFLRLRLPDLFYHIQIELIDFSKVVCHRLIIKSSVNLLMLFGKTTGIF